MKLANKTPLKFSRTRVLAFLASSLLIFAAFAQAQAPQLSLADLLIGLRSKKVSLPERNTILTEAVRQRGVTFTMSPEIEKELATTGASPTLIEAIRQKGSVVKTVATSSPKPTPVATPAPPDFSFYQTRADQNAGKGEYPLALADYNKTLEMKADNQVAYLNRGKLRVHRLNRGFAWLDAGTSSSLHEASAYVQTIEKRQGIKIGCPEEAAFRRRFIDLPQFESLIFSMPTCEYHDYLGEVAKDAKRTH